MGVRLVINSIVLINASKKQRSRAYVHVSLACVDDESLNIKEGQTPSKHTCVHTKASMTRTHLFFEW